MEDLRGEFCEGTILELLQIGGKFFPEEPGEIGELAEEIFVTPS